MSHECYENQNFQFFQTLTQLRKLNISFSSKFLLKSLQNCKQLTHLKVVSNESLKHCFTDIHLYLPQLTHFYCHFFRYITDEELKPLAKLKHLKHVMINFCDCDSSLLTDESFCEIINNCPEMRSILMNKRPKITHKTIDALISLAERKPFRHFVYSFGRKSCNKSDDYLEFLSGKKYENVPKNLNFIPYDRDTTLSFANHR